MAENREETTLMEQAVRLAKAAYTHNDMARARQHYQGALEQWLQLGVRPQAGVADTLDALVRVAINQGELDEALRSGADALAIWRELGDKKRSAETSVLLLEAAGRKQEYELAQDHQLVPGLPFSRNPQRSRS